MFTGAGAFQWEHHRTWQSNAASESCRAEGALHLPDGFASWSVFFRRGAQTAGTFELLLWTTPIYFQTLDTLIDSATASATLLPVGLTPSGGLLMTGTSAKVFGAKIGSDQPMGSLLFWEVRNTVAAGVLTGDIYLVPNHTGTVTLPRVGRTVDASGQAMPGLAGGARSGSYRAG
jgi:hypothetical protein